MPNLAEIIWDAPLAEGLVTTPEQWQADLDARRAADRAARYHSKP